MLQLQHSAMEASTGEIGISIKVRHHPDLSNSKAKTPTPGSEKYDAPGVEPARHPGSAE